MSRLLEQLKTGLLKQLRRGRRNACWLVWLVWLVCGEFLEFKEEEAGEPKLRERKRGREGVFIGMLRVNSLHARVDG